MKATFSEEYYKMFWEKFLVKVPGNDYFNAEEKLSSAMSVYENIGLSEDQYKAVKKLEASKIAEELNVLVHKELQVAKDIKAGKASFGMVTKSQEISAEADFIKRFEFNCLQLREFRKKYC